MNTLKLVQIDAEGMVLEETPVRVLDKSTEGKDLSVRKLLIEADGDITCCLNLTINIDGTINNIELQKYK